jgi:hypothetical protein
VLAVVIERLFDFPRWGRFAAGALVVLWVGWGLWMFAGDVRGRFIRPGYDVALGFGSDQVAKTTRLPPARLAR